jgi:hypothetical protein
MKGVVVEGDNVTDAGNEGAMVKKVGGTVVFIEGSFGRGKVGATVAG